MKSANHILGDKNDLQNIIGQAVANLSGHGETDRGLYKEFTKELLHYGVKRQIDIKIPKNLKK